VTAACVRSIRRRFEPVPGAQRHCVTFDVANSDVERALAQRVDPPQMEDRASGTATRENFFADKAAMRRLIPALSRWS